MNAESQLLSQIESHAGYRLLEQRWIVRISEIEEKRDKAAQRGSESAWRYWAGVEKGYKEAVSELKIALAEMDNQVDNENADDRMQAILKDLKGESR